MKLRATVALLALAIPALAQQSTKITRLDGTSITTAEAEAFARKTLANTHTTGAQISILNHGKEVWSFSYGLAGKNPDRPMDRETTLPSASITKSLFATYVMMLVERGQFNLDKPIMQQLPQPLDTYAPYHDTASLLVHDSNWPLVTPRMLLAHTSGLSSGAYSEPDKKFHLHFKPGTHWLYSNDAVVLLQFVIEQQLHRPLADLIQEAIFTPLNMTRTGFIYHADFSPNISARFDVHDGDIPDTHPSVARASGSMNTSADDLARFLTALFANRILKPATRKAMLTAVIPIDSDHESTFSGHHPNDAEVKPIGFAYGIGWGLITHTRFGPSFFKEGHIGGANAYVICFDRSQSCMILLTNNDNGELAYRPLLEKILGDTVTPWEWEGYPPAAFTVSHSNP